MSFLLLIVLPHLFGVLIVLGALLGRAARPLAGIRAGVRVHLILWFCAHAFTLWRAWMSGGENEHEAAGVYSVLSVGVVALGVPWLPRSRSRWTDARFVCRGQQVGALLSLLWFGQWAVTNRIFYGLPVAMLAAASMLAGGFLRGRAEPLPSERP